MIDRQTVDRIIDAANIYDVVSDYVSLRRSGTSYKGLCPFHDDKTPSFYVNPAKGVCKCFACGKGGSAVGFIMEIEQMSYPEALKYLAKKFNIEIKCGINISHTHPKTCSINPDFIYKVFQSNHIFTFAHSDFVTIYQKIYKLA